MELTDKQKNIITISIIGLVGVALVIFIIQGFRSYLVTRSPVPALSETIVGGRIKGALITAGQHTLQFRAKVNNGQMVSDQVTFTATSDPYGDAYESSPY